MESVLVWLLQWATVRFPVKPPAWGSPAETSMRHGGEERLVGQKRWSTAACAAFVREVLGQECSQFGTCGIALERERENARIGGLAESCLFCLTSPFPAKQA